MKLLFHNKKIAVSNRRRITETDVFGGKKAVGGFHLFIIKMAGSLKLYMFEIEKRSSSGLFANSIPCGGPYPNLFPNLT